MSTISIFTGDGRGKSSAAIGEALIRAASGDKAVVIQFLKGKGETEQDLISRLSPEFRLFRFEKSDSNFCELPKDRQEEEIANIRNGLNYARKVISTGECNLLVLDEILGILDNGIISSEELKELILSRPENMDIIMTGIYKDSMMLKLADSVSEIKNLK